MASVIPLDDHDRIPWLNAIGKKIRNNKARGLVITCSALKLSYRNILRSYDNNAFNKFLYFWS